MRKTTFFVLSLSLLLLQACRFNPSDGLSWNTDLLAPIAKSEVSITDIVQDSSILSTGNDQLLRLTVRDTLAQTSLIDL
ncbi:MAG: hypothetical protein AAF206_08455, partial [Bacteroidota bacterium]